MRGPARLSTEAMGGACVGEKERGRRRAARGGVGGGGGECRVGKRRSTREGHVRSSIETKQSVESQQERESEGWVGEIEGWRL